MKVPFNDLRRAAVNESESLFPLMQAVVSSGWYIMGGEVEHFEKEFADYIGVRHAVSVANGTDALELALRSLEVGPGQEVITVANAGMYASTAIRKVGAVPRYVEVDECSMNMDPAALSPDLAKRAGAVILTHLFGRLANVQAVADWCHRHGVPLIEDCAQAHGAHLAGIRAGSFGRLACFSFYPTKNLGALGDGGAVVTSDQGLAARLRELRQYGWRGKYHVALAGGGNSRLDEIQAAVLRYRLRSLDLRNTRRQQIAAAYNRGVKHPSIATPDAPEGEYVAHLYVVRSEERDSLRRHLTEHGVATDVHYPVCDHLQPAYSTETSTKLPVTEKLAGEVLSLPCFPELTDEEVAHVISACNAWDMR